MAPSRQNGAVLAIVLVLLAAAASLAASVAGSAALELGMTARTADTVQAFRAADAGLRAALASGAWDPAVEWRNTATLPGGARWTAAMRLAAVGVPPPPAPTEWHFEIESTGELDGATASLVQGFVVRGALPGTAEPSWWRQEDPEP
jgi:hypothetical protein